MTDIPKLSKKRVRFTNEQIAKIAAGLSEAQRAMILDLPADGKWMRMYPLERYGKYGKNALCGFGKSGLIEGCYSRHSSLQYRLTPPGQQVRAHIGESHDLCDAIERGAHREKQV